MIQYRVVNGDTLSGIAKRYCGDGNKWREIFEANRDIITNPDIISVGMVLNIPCADEVDPSPDDLTFGIDVSQFQDVINWSHVASSEIKFAFIRAHTGASADPLFTDNWLGAKAAGVIRGAYHFFRVDKDPQRQADEFVSLISSIADNDLPPVVDIEIVNRPDLQLNVGFPGAQWSTNLQTWLGAVTEALNRTPIIYTGPYVWNEALQSHSQEFGEYHLWVADYRLGRNKPRPTATRPQNPMGSSWTEWTFWQFTDSGREPGIINPVDLDWFNGNENQLKDFIVNSRTVNTNPT